MSTTLAGLTQLMSGGSRGIGLAIATRAAQDDANLVLLAKTAEPQPKLDGTVHTAAAQIESAGGQALAVVGDVRNDDDAAARAVGAAVDRFGGIDIVVNNASGVEFGPPATFPWCRRAVLRPASLDVRPPQGR